MQRIILSGCLIINERKELLLLFRDKHNHYETPGGKVEDKDCQGNCELDDLENTALRELKEEIGDVKVEFIEYFGKVEFEIPDGRLAIANKFIVKISGTPKIMEKHFSKLDWLPILKLQDYPLSPDLKLFRQRIQIELLAKHL